MKFLKSLCFTILASSLMLGQNTSNTNSASDNIADELKKLREAIAEQQKQISQQQEQIQKLEQQLASKQDVAAKTSDVAHQRRQHLRSGPSGFRCSTTATGTAESVAALVPHRRRGIHARRLCGF